MKNDEDIKKMIIGLLSKDEKLELKDKLAGGVISDVFNGVYTDTEGEQHNVAVKYTKENISVNNHFCALEEREHLSVAAKSHTLDLEIKKRLSVTTPVVLRDFSKEKVTIMKNFIDDGYELMQDMIINENLPMVSSGKTGEALAVVRYEMENMEGGLTQLESGDEQFHQRFYELIALLYNGRMNYLHSIMKEFLEPENKSITWTDGHPKNIAVNKNGDIIVFDFGRSIVCDQEYILPNFLGQISLFVISNTMDLDFGIEYMQKCIKAYIDKYAELVPGYELDEKLFVQYSTAELLHRGMSMRWIDAKITEKSSEEEIKNASMHFGDIVFDKENPIVTIDSFIHVIKGVARAIKKGSYKRPKIV